MRRSILPILLTLTLLAGCSKPATGPSQPAAPEPAPASAPAPVAQGVALADLDLANAPALEIQQATPPAGNGPAPDLTDTSFVNSHDGYAVTHGGVIARTRDGGATWTQVYLLKGGRFSRVDAVDSQAVFAVAQTGCDPGPNCDGPNVLLRTTDGGQSWSQLQPKLPAFKTPDGSSSTQLNPWLSFQFLSAQVGYAGGDVNENHFMSAIPLIVTRDGGQTWTEVKLPDGLSFGKGFFFADPDHGYVTAAGPNSFQLLATEDGGRSWQTLYTTNKFGLYAVQFLTPDDGYIGGGNSPKTEAQPRQVILATHDAGKSWSVVSSVEDRGSPVVRLHMDNANEGWAARGGCWSMGGNGPCGGPLLYTRDGGHTWTDTGRFTGRIRSAGAEAWVIDSTGATTLMRTGDGGATWQQLTRPDAVRVFQVQFLDPKVGFMGTNFGFYQTTDGGKSWTPHPLGRSFGWSDWPLFLDEKNAVAMLSGDLLRSTDGGLTWEKVSTPLPEKTEYISMPALTASGPAAGGATGSGPREAWLAMESVQCMNPDCPVLLVDSKDGGATWQEYPPGPPMHVTQMAFADSLHGVGFPFGNKLLLTTDGGKNWTVQTGPKGLSLHYGGFAGSPDNLWVSGTYMPGNFSSPGILLHSTDGGQHWVAVQGKYGWIGQIQFVSAQDGWATDSAYADSSGLLVTHDGGRTWSEVWPTLPTR